MNITVADAGVPRRHQAISDQHTKCASKLKECHFHHILNYILLTLHFFITQKVLRSRRAPSLCNSIVNCTICQGHSNCLDNQREGDHTSSGVWDKSTYITPARYQLPFWKIAPSTFDHCQALNEENIQWPAVVQLPLIVPGWCPEGVWS